MRSSMAWPCSSRCSISMSSFTPSTTICTSSTSEKPRRSAFETSKTPPTAAVSTPPGETSPARRGGRGIRTRCRGRRASRGPCPKPAAGATRAYRKGSGRR
uniref:Uncharacterized protein n=1 Tax=Bos mutus grunniens TaxID=30521 RepID=A0A8B9YMT0_BOSMU